MEAPGRGGFPARGAPPPGRGGEGPPPPPAIRTSFSSHAPCSSDFVSDRAFLVLTENVDRDAFFILQVLEDRVHLVRRGELDVVHLLDDVPVLEPQLLEGRPRPDRRDAVACGAVPLE